MGQAPSGEFISVNRSCVATQHTLTQLPLGLCRTHVEEAATPGNLQLDRKSPQPMATNAAAFYSPTTAAA